jgi:hypothetical protein
MSQRDLVAELHAAHISAPPELRIRVRAIAAAAPGGPRRRIQLRRALILALPVAAAVAAGNVLTRPSHPVQTAAHGGAAVDRAAQAQAQRQEKTFATQGAPTAPAPAPSQTRVQRYGADLTLRIPTADGVSRAVSHALRITTSLGGYASAVHVDRSAKTATASLVLRVPRSHVQEAVSRLAALGTVTHEHVDVQDLQAGLNDTDRTIARLQSELRKLRAQTQTPDVVQRIQNLTMQVQRLQRSEQTTVRTAHFARVSLSLATPPPAPHHAQRRPWFAAGAGALVLLLVAWIAWRLVQRRREAALLSSR